MDKGLIGFIIIVLGLGTFVISVIWLRINSLKRQLEQFLPMLKGQIVTDFWGFSATLKGIWEKEEIEIKLDLKPSTFGRGALPIGTPSLFITFHYSYPFSFEIIPVSEEKFLVLVPQKGFLNLRISEDELNSNLPLQPTQAEKIREFLTQKRKEIIHSILKKGFNHIKIFGDYITIEMVRNLIPIPKDILTTESISEILEKVQEFSK